MGQFIGRWYESGGISSLDNYNLLMGITSDIFNAQQRATNYLRGLESRRLIRRNDFIAVTGNQRPDGNIVMINARRYVGSGFTFRKSSTLSAKFSRSPKSGKNQKMLLSQISEKNLTKRQFRRERGKIRQLNNK